MNSTVAEHYNKPHTLDFAMYDPGSAAHIIVGERTLRAAEETSRKRGKSIAVTSTRDRDYEDKALFKFGSGLQESRGKVSLHLRGDVEKVWVVRGHLPFIFGLPYLAKHNITADLAQGRVYKIVSRDPLGAGHLVSLKVVAIRSVSLSDNHGELASLWLPLGVESDFLPPPQHYKTATHSVVIKQPIKCCKYISHL